MNRYLLIAVFQIVSFHLLSAQNVIDTNAVPVFEIPFEVEYTTCAASVKGFSFSIDSCNCEYIRIDGFDTIFIELNPMMGGEIIGNILKINCHECDSAVQFLVSYTERFVTFSMGPDLIYDDWIHYYSPVDTMHFDKAINGFRVFIDYDIEHSNFPKFDTLDFYIALLKGEDAYYQTQRGKNYYDRKRMLKEFNKNRKEVEEVLERSSGELDKVIIVAKKGDEVFKTFVFNYVHNG
jgi:hypothetical protein